MRVIAGKARRLALKTVPGMETRPTTDRIKETLFNMIQDELYGIRFLDLFLFGILQGNAKTSWLRIIPVGIIYFFLYYFIFSFLIKKLDLKTPGREDDDAEELKATLANNDYTSVAKTVLEGVGGPENVASIDNCITRLRLEVKDYTKVNEKVIKSAGVAGVMRPSKTSVQVIIGTQVQFVADEFKKLCK